MNEEPKLNSLGETKKESITRIVRSEIAHASNIRTSVFDKPDVFETPAHRLFIEHIAGEPYQQGCEQCAEGIAKSVYFQNTFPADLCLWGEQYAIALRDAGKK